MHHMDTFEEDSSLSYFAYIDKFSESVGSNIEIFEFDPNDKEIIHFMIKFTDHVPNLSDVARIDSPRLIQFIENHRNTSKLIGISFSRSAFCVVSREDQPKFENKVIYTIVLIEDYISPQPKYVYTIDMTISAEDVVPKIILRTKFSDKVIRLSNFNVHESHQQNHYQIYLKDANNSQIQHINPYKTPKDLRLMLPKEMPYNFTRKPLEFKQLLATFISIFFAIILITLQFDLTESLRMLCYGNIDASMLCVYQLIGYLIFHFILSVLELIKLRPTKLILKIFVVISILSEMYLYYVVALPYSSSIQDISVYNPIIPEIENKLQNRHAWFGILNGNIRRTDLLHELRTLVVYTMLIKTITSGVYIYFKGLLRA